MMRRSLFVLLTEALGTIMSQPYCYYGSAKGGPNVSQAVLWEGGFVGDYIAATCRRMGERFTKTVNLVKEPGFLQKIIEAQIEVFTLIFLPH